MAKNVIEKLHVKIWIVISMLYVEKMEELGEIDKQDANA